uniref:Ig-like domain-containing protein n=1 Tax=Chelydra serpentina TaxID=8475 RepID=A0A8C3XNE8_CHESE
MKPVLCSPAPGAVPSGSPKSQVLRLITQVTIAPQLEGYDLNSNTPNGSSRSYVDMTDISVSPGQTVALECAVANVTPDKVNVNWIRQSPGQKPEGVLFFKTDLSISRAPGIPERYVPSRDASNKKFLLTIGDVQEGDDSTYFCFAYYARDASHHLQCPLCVSAGSNLPRPRIQLFPPAQEEIATGFATLTCLVSGFFPGYIDVLWRRDSQPQAQGVRTGLVALGEDKTYAVSSYLTVPASEWGSGAGYSCVVNHESLASALEESVSAKDCKRQ